MSLSLATLLFKSIGAGYGALNIAARDSQIEILEFAPLGTKAHLILKGNPEHLNDYITRLRTTDIERTLVIENLPEILIKNYLSLEFASLKKFMLVYEASFVGDLFLLAKEFLKLDLSVVDFRVQRMENSPGFLILTGENAERIKNKTQQLKREGHLITYIPNLSENLNTYFD